MPLLSLTLKHIRGGPFEVEAMPILAEKSESGEIIF